MITPTYYSLRWDSVPHAVSGWEIQINGAKVATAGARARTTRLSAKPGKMTVKVVDLPGRFTEQVAEFVSEVV